MLGAVYIPLAEIVPPLAVQFTLVLVVPATVAANCWLCPVCSEIELGEMATLTPAEGCDVAADAINNKELDFRLVTGLSIRMVFVRAVATSAAETVTVALFELTTVVGSWEPFHSTTHILQKLLPVMLRAKLALPAVTFPGESELKTGVLRFTLSIGGIMGSSAAQKDTTKVRKTSNNSRLFTGIS